MIYSSVSPLSNGMSYTSAGPRNGPTQPSHPSHHVSPLVYTFSSRHTRHDPPALFVLYLVKYLDMVWSVKRRGFVPRRTVERGRSSSSLSGQSAFPRPRHRSSTPTYRIYHTCLGTFRGKFVKLRRSLAKRQQHRFLQLPIWIWTSMLSPTHSSSTHSGTKPPTQASGPKPYLSPVKGKPSKLVS